MAGGDLCKLLETGLGGIKKKQAPVGRGGATKMGMKLRNRIWRRQGRGENLQLRSLYPCLKWPSHFQFMPAGVGSGIINEQKKDRRGVLYVLQEMGQGEKGATVRSWEWGMYLEEERKISRLLTWFPGWSCLPKKFVLWSLLLSFSLT